MPPRFVTIFLYSHNNLEFHNELPNELYLTADILIISATKTVILVKRSTLYVVTTVHVISNVLIMIGGWILTLEVTVDAPGKEIFFFKNWFIQLDDHKGWGGGRSNNGDLVDFGKLLQAKITEYFFKFKFTNWKSDNHGEKD